MHGKGLYTWKDGRRYEGDYVMDKKHGHGRYRWADGRIYDGPWVNGRQHGKGEYILPDGSKKMGVWVDGKRVNWLDQDKTEDAGEGTAEPVNQQEQDQE